LIFLFFVFQILQDGFLFKYIVFSMFKFDKKKKKNCFTILFNSFKTRAFPYSFAITKGIIVIFFSFAY